MVQRGMGYSAAWLESGGNRRHCGHIFPPQSTHPILWQFPQGRNALINMKLPRHCAGDAVTTVKWTFMSHVLFLSCLSRIHQEVSGKAGLTLNSVHLDPNNTRWDVWWRWSGAYVLPVWKLGPLRRNISSCGCWSLITSETWATGILESPWLSHRTSEDQGGVWKRRVGQRLPKQQTNVGQMRRKSYKKDKTFRNLKPKDTWWWPNSGATCPLVPGKAEVIW